MLNRYLLLPLLVFSLALQGCSTPAAMASDPSDAGQMEFAVGDSDSLLYYGEGIDPPVSGDASRTRNAILNAYCDNKLKETSAPYRWQNAVLPAVILAPVLIAIGKVIIDAIASAIDDKLQKAVAEYTQVFPAISDASFYKYTHDNSHHAYLASPCFRITREVDRRILFDAFFAVRLVDASGEIIEYGQNDAVPVSMKILPLTAWLNSDSKFQGVKTNDGKFTISIALAMQAAPTKAGESNFIQVMSETILPATEFDLSGAYINLLPASLSDIDIKRKAFKSVKLLPQIPWSMTPTGENGGLVRVAFGISQSGDVPGFLAFLAKAFDKQKSDVTDGLNGLAKAAVNNALGVKG